jgi:hypothetical protein
MTSGVYKIEQFYLNKCKNEKEFHEKINGMNLSEIREIVYFAYIIREGNPSFQKKRLLKNFNKKSNSRSPGNTLDQATVNSKRLKLLKERFFNTGRL